MGGHALKQTFTRRYQVKEYRKIRSEILGNLKDAFNNIKCKDVIAYKNKSDFGDMDVLIQSTDLPNNYKDIIKDIFKPNEMISNGPCLSFDYKELQIDLILSPESEYEFSIHYYAFNDLGNLIGRIAHKFGIKFGHTGMWYVYRDGTQVLKKMLLTRNPREAFEFLGFSYDRWLTGFNEIEDIFEYVLESKYFNPNVYLFENLNHQARTRDRKRKTYAVFVDKCEQIKNNPGFYQFENESIYLLNMFDKFPEFKDEYIEVTKNYLLRKEVKKKFNGDIVRNITGLDGKDLGLFMVNNKNFFSDTFVLSQTNKVIKNKIYDLYKRVNAIVIK